MIAPRLIGNSDARSNERDWRARAAIASQTWKRTFSNHAAPRTAVDGR